LTARPFKAHRRIDDANRGVDEYSTLAERVAAGIGDVHGCLILSRDGMVLGAYPFGDEAVAKPAWLRFASLGGSRRGFVEFGDQVWVFVHRGPYAAFAVAGSSVRPGLLMDQMEQVLLVAEEARSRREPLKLPEVKVAPSGKPRARLRHSLERPPEPATEPASAAGHAPDEAMASRPGSGQETSAVEGESSTGESTEHQEAEPGDEAEPAAQSEPKEPPRLFFDDGTEVDRVLLAKEFFGLLQVESEGDEASS
jgi:hypothetical protein